MSVDTQAQASAGLTAAFYSCDGVQGVWTYTVQGGPFDFDIDTTVDMEGGTGTLVISDRFEVPTFGTISFTDTIDLVIAGTADAPTFKATAIDVEDRLGGPRTRPDREVLLPEEHRGPDPDRCRAVLTRV